MAALFAGVFLSVVDHHILLVLLLHVIGLGDIGDLGSMVGGQTGSLMDRALLGLITISLHVI